LESKCIRFNSAPLFLDNILDGFPTNASPFRSFGSPQVQHRPDGEGAPIGFYSPMMAIWKSIYTMRDVIARQRRAQVLHNSDINSQQLRTARSSHHQAPFGGGGKRPFPRDAALSVGGGGYFGGHSYLNVNWKGVFPAITTRFAADQSLD